ncbi:MAG: hypothetical protein ACE5G9_04370 [Nitrospinales bacterium]
MECCKVHPRRLDGFGKKEEEIVAAVTHFFLIMKGKAFPRFALFCEKNTLARKPIEIFGIMPLNWPLAQGKK